MQFAFSPVICYTTFICASTREGEKLHEIMVTVEDSMNTYEYDKHFIVYPQMVWSDNRRAVPTGKHVPEGFSYSSGNNTEWLSIEEIKELLMTVNVVGS